MVRLLFTGAICALFLLCTPAWADAQDGAAPLWLSELRLGGMKPNLEARQAHSRHIEEMATFLALSTAPA